MTTMIRWITHAPPAFAIPLGWRICREKLTKTYTLYALDVHCLFFRIRIDYPFRTLFEGLQRAHRRHPLTLIERMHTHIWASSGSFLRLLRLPRVLKLVSKRVFPDILARFTGTTIIMSYVRWAIMIIRPSISQWIHRRYPRTCMHMTEHLTAAPPPRA